MNIFAKTLSFSLALSLLASAGCGASNKSCLASNSWAQPVWSCGAEPALEPEVEPEPEPEPARVRRSEDKIEILEKVLFETGSASIDPASYELLDEVARVLTDADDITKVRVEGHTDDTGSKGLNQGLSEKRANSVREYLIEKGIAAERLEAQGFGQDQPIADNESADGRDKNRRVEFTILEQGSGG